MLGASIFPMYDMLAMSAIMKLYKLTSTYYSVALFLTDVTKNFNFKRFCFLGTRLELQSFHASVSSLLRWYAKSSVILIY